MAVCPVLAAVVHSLGAGQLTGTDSWSQSLRQAVCRGDPVLSDVLQHGLPTANLSRTTDLPAPGKWCL